MMYSVLLERCAFMSHWLFLCTYYAAQMITKMIVYVCYKRVLTALLYKVEYIQLSPIGVALSGSGVGS